jgi:hypothetical protein
MCRLTAILSTLVLGFVITSVAVANPITIIGVSAPTLGDGLGIANDEFLQVSWSQTGSYTGVKISALLFGGIVNGSYLPTTGEAFLTSSLLSVPLKQIFTFPDPFFGPSSVSLFSGLKLPAGAYFLTFASTSPFGGALVSTLEASPNITLDQGVVLGVGQYAIFSNVNSANPPASVFIPINPSANFFFQVTGSPVVTPEPSSLLLTGTAIAGLLFRVRWHKRVCR